MADAARFGLRPTLFIGLGGTGHEVLVRLKARYLDAYGDEIFRITKFLSYDTADEAKDASREDGSFARLDRGTELLHIGNVPTTRILNQLDIHPTIKAWLPANMPGRAITAGAQQVRPMGRLALFHHFSMIQSTLEQGIRQLSNIRQRGPLGEGATIAKTQGMNVFVISSICGGTGSGMFIDMAYLVRQLCMLQGLDENYCNVNGVLVLPQAFATVGGDAIRANAYAALLELEHYTEGSRFTVEYPNRVHTDIRYRPFNICYLVDAVNEQGRMLSGLNELAPMMAEAIFLQTASQVGDAQKSVFDNVKSLDKMDQGYQTAYSGFGTASLVFPVEVIINACASRYCAELLRTSLLTNRVNQATVLEQVDAVMEKMRLSEDALRVEMGKDDRGRTMRVQLDPRSLEKVPDTDVVKFAIKRVQDEEDRGLNDSYQGYMELNLKRLRAEMSQTLNQEVNRIVDDPALGLDIAIEFLQSLEQAIGRVVGTFTEQRDELDRQATQAASRSSQLQENLVQATVSFFVGRGGRVAKERDNFINHHRSRLTALLNRNLLSLSLALLAYLSNDVVRVRHRELRTLRDKLQVAQERLNRQAVELANGKSRALSPLTYEITDADDVKKYYQEYARELTQELPRLFEENGALHTWAPHSYEQIHDMLLAFGRTVFSRVNDVNIEQVIMDKRHEEPSEVRLQTLRDDSIPFWNRDIIRMTDGGTQIETITVIGVPDKVASIYKEVREGEIVASTHNQHAITVLTTRHGLTIYALQQYEDYKRRYEYHRERQFSPLHCFDVINSQGMKRTFAVGQALGYIVKEGGNRLFLYQPPRPDALEEKIELGQGLNNAVERFLSVSDYVSQVDTSVNQHIKKEGNPATAAAIQRYIDSEYSRNPALKELERELRQLALEYKNEYLS